MSSVSKNKISHINLIFHLLFKPTFHPSIEVASHFQTLISGPFSHASPFSSFSTAQYLIHLLKSQLFYTLNVSTLKQLTVFSYQIFSCVFMYMLFEYQNVSPNLFRTMQ